MAECSSCHAPIRWATIASTGRSIPLDPEPVPTGNLIYVEEPAGDGDGTTVRVVGPPRPDGGLIGDEYAGRRFVSHFATCPNAAHHRKKR